MLNDNDDEDDDDDGGYDDDDDDDDDDDEYLVYKDIYQGCAGVTLSPSECSRPRAARGAALLRPFVGHCRLIPSAALEVPRTSAQAVGQWHSARASRACTSRTDTRA